MHLYGNFFSKYYAYQAFSIGQYLIFKNINQYCKSKIENYSRSLIGSDAHDSNLISYICDRFNEVGNFKQSNLYECSIPLNILIHRLKLSESQPIASAHQIKHSSKVKKKMNFKI